MVVWSAFLDHLGQIAVADAVFAISAHAEKDHIGRKPPALKHGHGADLIKLVRGTAPVTLLQQSRLQVPRKTVEQAAREAAASVNGRNPRPAWEQGTSWHGAIILWGCAFWWFERLCRMDPPSGVAPPLTRQAGGWLLTDSWDDDRLHGVQVSFKGLKHVAKSLFVLLHVCPGLDHLHRRRAVGLQEFDDPRVVGAAHEAYAPDGAELREERVGRGLQFVQSLVPCRRSRRPS